MEKWVNRKYTIFYIRSRVWYLTRLLHYNIKYNFRSWQSSYYSLNVVYFWKND